MPASPILPPDDPVSFPSMPTLHGGDADSLGRIDHYDLLRKLGGGGFGVVYLAKDTNSGVEVALKTLHPLLKTNAEEMDALREKFVLVSRLTHTNIAKALVLHRVHDLNIWDETARKEMRLSPGDSVMVMDYAPGVTLSRWRRQFPDGIVPLDLALELARQLASALDYAHGERIVHRDIKPANIMVETLRADEPRGASDHEVDNQGGNNDGGARPPGAPQLFTLPSSPFTSKLRVRLLDFGLAAEIRSSMSRVSTEQGDTSGTRPYMAPEQWLGKKQDGRTDQYALACVLYELLSGAPPFAGVFETGDPMIMMATVKSETPDEIEDVPKAFNVALLRALSKTPKERYPSCAEFVAALDETTKDAKYTQDDVGRAQSSSAPQGEPSDAVQEADVLRRKVTLARAFSAMPEGDRSDAVFATMLSEADTELNAAEEAFKYGRFAAAAQCLDRAEAALGRIRDAKEQRQKEENEHKAREEAERKKAEAERIRRECEEADRLRQEREAKARAEREREEQRRLGAEEELLAMQEPARQAPERPRHLGGWFMFLFSACVIGGLVWVFCQSNAGTTSPPTSSVRTSAANPPSTPPPSVRGDAAERQGGVPRASTPAGRNNHEHDRVRLWAGGPYWATRNIGAEKPEDFGLYFWWGDMVGYRRDGDAWVASDGSSRNFKFSEENTPIWGKDNATLRGERWTTPAGVLAPAHDAAQAHWGGNWRMPTWKELSDLNSNCDWTWTTRNGVNGYVVRGRGAYGGASIFLPATGYGRGTSLGYAGSYGYYWSSVPDSDDYGSWRLAFGSGSYGVDYGGRYVGRSVRPVQGFTE